MLDFKAVNYKEKDNKNLVPPANTEQMTLKRSKNDDGTPQNQEWVNLMEQVDSLYDEGEYQKAIFYGKKALQVIEQFREPDHSEVMETLNNLGMLYMKTKDFTEAEPLLKRAVSIAEKRDDQETLAAALGNLANVYSDQEMYKKAEPLLVRSLSIAEKMYGPNHPDVALAINNLAVNYHCQKKYEHLVTLYKRAISILEATGSNDGVLLHLLNNLAEVYHELGVIEQSEPLYVRALSLGKKKYGRDHPEMAATMRNLARLYEETNRPLEAEELKKRAAEVSQKTVPDTPA